MSCIKPRVSYENCPVDIDNTFDVNSNNSDRDCNGNDRHDINNYLIYTTEAYKTKLM